MATRKPAKPKDKSVFDIRVAATHGSDWLTLAISADATLVDLHLAIFGALHFRGEYLDIEQAYRFTIDGAVYEKGRGSRMPLRRLIQPGIVFAHTCVVVIGLSLTCTVEHSYEVASRRHYPKVIADSAGSGEYDLKRATWDAQYAAWRQYQFQYR